MQISSAGLIAVQQQARAQPAPQRVAARQAQADELFEPLFGKIEEKPAANVSTRLQDTPAPVFTRPGSQVDIQI